MIQGFACVRVREEEPHPHTHTEGEEGGDLVPWVLDYLSSSFDIQIFWGSALSPVSTYYLFGDPRRYVTYCMYCM